MIFGIVGQPEKGDLDNKVSPSIGLLTFGCAYLAADDG